MPRWPRITGAEAVGALEQDGWQLARIHGSHHHLTHSAKPGVVTVAVHAGQIIPPKTMRSIIRNAGLTVQELIDLL